MQTKPCPEDNTKIHYFDDDFECHIDTTKLNQQLFDELKALIIIYDFKVIFRCNMGVVAFSNAFVYEKKHMVGVVMYLYIVLSEKYYVIDNPNRYTFDTIYEVYSYLDTINIPRNVLNQNKLTHNIQ